MPFGFVQFVTHYCSRGVISSFGQTTEVVGVIMYFTLSISVDEILNHICVGANAHEY